jgi:3-oxoacyl-[acyl-carrier protein] reductase
MEFGIKDRVALVFGAAGGLSAEIARSLAGENCKVALADANEAGLAPILEAIEAKGRRAVSLGWTLGDASAIDPKVTLIEERLGPIHILINNTGGPPPSLASNTPLEAWVDQFEKMVASVIAVTGRVLRSMRQRGWGRIITSASSGVVTPIPNLAVSNALRSALVGWLKTLAREVARDGVMVNVVGAGADRDCTDPKSRRGVGGEGRQNGRRNRRRQRRRHYCRTVWPPEGIRGRHRVSRRCTVVLRDRLADQG